MAGDIVGWLRLQDQRKDQIGDLARELVRNPIAPKKGAMPTLRRHLYLFSTDFESALAQAKSEFDNRPAGEVKREKNEQNLRKMERALRLPQLVGTPTEVDKVRPNRPDIIMQVLGRALDYTFYLGTLQDKGELSSSDWMEWVGVFNSRVELGILKEKRAAWWLEHLDTPVDAIVRELLGNAAASLPDVQAPTHDQLEARRKKIFGGYRSR